MRPILSHNKESIFTLHFSNIFLVHQFSSEIVEEPAAKFCFKESKSFLINYSIMDTPKIAVPYNTGVYESTLLWVMQHFVERHSTG